MMDRVRKYQLIISILFAIACIGYLIAVFYLDIETEVMRDRFRNANAFFEGGPLNMEYPPFAIMFMAVPRLFASTEFGYNVAYVAEVYIFLIIGMFAVCWLAKHMEYSREKAMLAYAILMLLLLEFVVDRYDIFPAILTLLSFCCFLSKKYPWAFILLALGAMTKLYPAVLFPIYLIPLLMDRDWKEVLKNTGIFILTSLLVTVPLLLMDSGALSYFIEYHADRPLQIESIFASLIYPFSMLGLTDTWIEYTYGSDNLVGPLPDAVAALLTPLMIISILLLYLIYAHVLKGERKEDGTDRNKALFLFGSVILLAIMLFMMVGKVFSSQYLIWMILPFLFILMATSDEKFKRNMFLMVVICVILTQVNFAYSIGYLGGGENINDIGMMIILARNIVMIAFTAYLVKYLYSGYIEPGFRKRRYPESEGDVVVK